MCTEVTSAESIGEGQVVLLEDPTTGHLHFGEVQVVLRGFNTTTFRFVDSGEMVRVRNDLEVLR